MFFWGLAGASAGLLQGLYPNIGIKGLAFFNFIWGYLFGCIMTLWSWAAFIQPLNWQSFVLTYAASFWFDTFHAMGNVVFCLLFGASFIKILKRFQRKLRISIFDENICQIKNLTQDNSPLGTALQQQCTKCATAIF